MKYWLRPANKSYDIFKSFEELKIVDWGSNNNYSVGDIVYIYCGLPLQKITHKCRVIKIDVPENELIDDSKYIIDKAEFESRPLNDNYIRLELIEEFKGTVTLDDINVLMLRSAITILKSQADIIDEKSHVLSIEDKICYQYNKWVKENKSDIEKREKEVNKLINNFLVKFTKNKILNMTLDDYVEGKESKDSFCYWVENNLKSAGDIHGATAYKFGIYYSKKHNDYEIQTPKYPNDKNKAFKEIKQAIIDVIEASTNHDLEIITNSKLSNMFKNKISFLYNRNDYLPIYSDDDIKKLLIIFEMPHDIKNESIERKKDRLYNFYKSLNLGNCSPWRFMDFIYNKDNEYRSILRNEELNDFINSNNKKIIIEEINDLSDLFEERNFKERKSIYKSDPDKERSNKLAGTRGEDRIIDYFEKNKDKLGIVSIKYYCKTDGPDANDLAGCDIEYVDKNDETWYVEVKSTRTNNVEKENFFMSDIEYNKMKENRDNYYILYFNNVYKDSIVKKIPAKLIIGKEHPVKYTFNIKEMKDEE